VRQPELETWLIDTLTDFKLSHSEALELRELLPQLRTDETSFIRNKAFALVREQVRAGGENAVASLIWLEKIIKTIDNFRQSAVVVVNSAHFSPGDDCRKKLMDLCQSAKQSLDISVFTISDDRLCAAICAAHVRGVAVRIITDDDKTLDLGSDIEHMIAQGIPVRMDSEPHHMHHKFALIDNHTLVNGSFNWTRSASEKNQENILVTNELGLVAAYQQEFEDLWREFAP
jgi:phosphatidylserine/phosphatidylglycerophosphate/cardiolipin synthase-like enzyme